MEELRSWSGLLLFLLGALFTLTAETGYKWVARRARRTVTTRRSRWRLARHGRSGELVVRGDEKLFVAQFVPTGWDPARIHCRTIPSALGEEEAELRASGQVPQELAEVLVERITALRAELPSDSAAGTGDWNGEKLALVHLDARSRTARDEQPVLHLDFRVSDHAAATACSRTWLEWIDSGRLPAVDADDLADVVPVLSHSFGLNATVVTSDGQLVLVGRSRQASSGRTGWHISVNEGMVPGDVDRLGRLSPHHGLVRGVAEELGLDVDVRHVSIHTAMLDVRRYQWGLLGHVDLRGTSITAARVLESRRCGLARDKAENRHLELVDWTPSAVLRLLEQDDWIAHGWLNLAQSAIQTWGPDERISRLLSAPR